MSHQCYHTHYKGHTLRECHILLAHALLFVVAEYHAYYISITRMEVNILITTLHCGRYIVIDYFNTMTLSVMAQLSHYCLLLIKSTTFLITLT